MQWIDYGLSVLRADAVRELIPSGEHQDLAHFFTTLSRQGRLGCFVASDRFYEIGSPEGLAELDLLLTSGADAP